MSETIDPERINWLAIQFGRQHHIRLHKMMAEIGLYRGQPPLLHILWEHEGITQSELSKKMHIQPATLTKMLQRMEHAGLIIRKADPADQRVMRVYLTQAGWGIQTVVRTHERQIGVEMLANFSPEQQALIQDFLIRMRNNLQTVNEQNTPLPLILTEESLEAE